MVDCDRVKIDPGNCDGEWIFSTQYEYELVELIRHIFLLNKNSDLSYINKKVDDGKSLII